MSETESWVYVRADGAIMRHTENDGYRYMRYGAEAHEEVIASSIFELKLHNPKLAADLLDKYPKELFGC
jgi:hypothetical protein